MHKAIVDNIYENTNDYMHETFKLPDYINELIKNNKLGTKTGEGLYKEDGKKVYDINTKSYRETKQYKIDFIDKVIEKFKTGDYEEGINIILNDKSTESKICMELLVDYIIYSIWTSMEVSENTTDSDIAMAEGFNWIPPYCLIKLIGKEECKKIGLEDLKLDNKIIDKVFCNDVTSNYQYQRFLKAKR